MSVLGIEKFVFQWYLEELLKTILSTKLMVKCHETLN